MKKCTTCNKELPFDNFYKNKSIKSGYTHACKECTKNKSKERHKVKIVITEKVCSKCSTSKSVSEFYKKAVTIDGFRPECKQCTEKVNTAYEVENSVKLKEKMSEYRTLNKERIDEYNKNYREENREEIRVRSREFARKFVKTEAYHRYKTHYYAMNKDKIKAINRDYNKKNPQSRVLRESRRRALKMLLPSKLCKNDWENVLDYFSGNCALTDSKNISLEHFVPISLGHCGTYIGNVYPLDLNLNISKNNSNPFEWVKLPHIRKVVDYDKWLCLIEYLAIQNGLTVSDFEQFVYWCYENPRTLDEIKLDPNITSLELWGETKTTN